MELLLPTMELEIMSLYFEVQIKWTNGKINNFKITETGKTYTFKQS